MQAMQELNARLATLAALNDKLSGMSLTDEEQEILDELLTAEQGRARHTWLEQRAAQAITIMFPVWRGSRIEKPAHPMWHEKSWWWNGASIEDLEECANGDATMDLTSYVGCGDTETIRNFRLKKEWLEADDMEATLKAYCVGQATHREQERVAREMARAQAELASAQAHLASLGGAQ